MPDFVRIPWLQWKRFRIEGVVVEKESRRPLADLTVRAFDKDVMKDDHLGDARTDAEGQFEIHFTDAAFKDILESRPDIYLCIFHDGGGEPLHDTSYAIRENASHEEYFEIEIPAADLPDAP